LVEPPDRRINQIKPFDYLFVPMEYRAIVVEGAAAFILPCTQNGGDAAGGMHRGRAVALAGKPVAEPEIATLGVADQFGKGFDLVDTETGNRAGPFGCARLQMRLELVGTIGKFCQIGAVGQIVTKQDAIKLRNQIIMKFPMYSESIDESVYIGSGLRLVWSYKYNDGEYIAPYTPWKSVTASGMIEHISPEPYMETIRLFSIRVPGTDPETDPQENRKTNKLEEFIHKYIPGQQGSKILKVQKSSRGESLCAQTDSRFCTRINKEHQRNHVWFWIKNGTIRQMCFDPDCKKFKGTEYALPPSILKECTE